ncbi:hypothetical protein Tco_1578458, partial [Tanacetum coccineum]
MLKMMVEVQDACKMFKKTLLRVAMFRNSLRMYKQIFELLILEMLQMFSVTTAMRKKDEAGVILSNEQNDFLLADDVQMEELKELSANICMMARIQPTNIDFDEGPSYDSAFIKVNNGSVDHDKHAHDSYELEQLARNDYKEAEKKQ